MTTLQLPEPELAGAVRAGAAGVYSLEAACELLISAGWLHRDDFTCFISTATSLTDGVTELAHIDWQAVITGREAGLLPCSSGESRLLRLAASIAAGIPVDLNDALSGLDHDSIGLVVQASATPTASVPPIMTNSDDMTRVTRKAGNRHTARHHQHGSSTLGSARQNRYTDPLHTASAERRHSAATRWLRDGVSIEVVSKLLGHSSVTTTSSTYGHLTVEDARAALERAGWLTGRGVTW